MRDLQIMDFEGRFDFLEHTADAYIAAYGRDMSEAFENAALAMFEVMTETRNVKPMTQENVRVVSNDEESLLYNWLESLLVKAETNESLYSKFRITRLDHSQHRFALEANIWGEKFDPQRHLQKVGVKAVTYHRMEIIREPGKITAKFILDI